MTPPRQRVLSAKLPAELIDALDEEATRQGTSRNALVRRALEQAVAGDLPLLDQERRFARAAARIAEERALAVRVGRRAS